MSKYVFDKPMTITDAEGRVARLRGEIMDIEAQLGDRDRKGLDGVRLSAEAFAEWRQRAKWAVRQRSAEVAYLQTWVARRHHNRLEAAYRRLQLEPDSPDSLLAAAYGVLRDLARERRVSLDQDEQVVVDAISRYFGPVVKANGRVVAPPPPRILGSGNDGEQEQGPSPAV